MANITTKVLAIRAAILGEEVRESIASGIESINTEVESTTSKQGDLEVIFNDLVINAGSDNAEIVASRGGEVSLPIRLGKADNLNNTMVQQLADMLTQVDEIPQQTYITEREKTVDVDAKLFLKANQASLNSTNSTVALKAEKTEVVAVSNQIANIVANNGNGTTPTELVDLRTGADGTVYTTAKLRADGETNKIPYKNINSTGLNNDSLITAFPSNSVSAIYFASDALSGFPSNNAGILETHRIASVTEPNFQLWYPYNSNSMWKRRCVAGAWQKWEDLTASVSANYLNSNLAVDFPPNKVTYSCVTFAMATGFPGTNAGMLTTFRFNISGADKQEFRPYKTNETWSRYSVNDGTWTVWKNVTGDFTVLSSTVDKHIADTQDVHQIPVRPLITFTTDDGFDNDYTILKPIAETYGVPFVFDIAPHMNGTVMTQAHALELQNVYGCELTAHSDTHVNLTTLTEAQVETELKTAKEYMISLGYNVKNMTYPNGASNPMIRRLTKKYYRCACSGSDLKTKVNRGAVPRADIMRVLLGAFFDPAIPNYPATNTLGYYKKIVDLAIEQNGWVVFCMHCSDPQFDETQQLYLKQTIEYIQSKGVEIVTLDKGFDVFGTVNEIGDFTRGENNTGLAISKSGKIGGITNIFTKPNLSSSTQLHDFPNNCVSHTLVGWNETLGFPTASGILETHKISDYYEYNFQMWYDTITNRVWKRRFSGDLAQPWEEIGGTAIKPINTYSNSSLITAFPKNKITYSSVDFAVGVGMPSDSAGLLITYRYDVQGTDRQEFKKYKSNETWSRWVNDDYSWSVWEKVTL